jgi:hypothetical protein
MIIINKNFLRLKPLRDETIKTPASVGKGEAIRIKPII